ncbi:DUF6350 family protein [Kitasatospora sp. NPDC058170]|uniref:cell division protein PerM n=1 Tax=Kitasatospora sp. NPDC058170 TaxID=3346364 RepID=UPI0036D81978
MTQLMGRPILEVPGELGAGPVLADLLAGVRTALLGLAVVAVPVLGLWVVTPYADDGAAGAARLAGALWLLGHGAPVLRGGLDAPLTVTPLLLSLLAVGQLHRAGARVAARRGARARWGGPVAVWAGYCAVALAVVVQCSGAGLFRARVLPDVLVVALLAAAATAAGARSAHRTAAGRAVHPPARSTGPDRSAGPGAPRWPALDRVPGWARPVGAAPVIRSAALAALAGLVAAGAVLVAVAAVLAAVGGGGPATAALGHGPAAVAGLLLLSVLLLPNAVLWGTAYALGPGFAAGTGTVVAPSGAALGPVPEFPLFALLPEPGAGGWRLLVCLLPVLAGAVPALLLGRAAAAGPAHDGRDGHDGLDGYDGYDGYDSRDGLDGHDGRDGGEDEAAERAAAPWHPAATAVAALAAALLTGGAAAALGWFSGGALAGGRMAELGPVPWRTGLAAAGWFAVVAVPGALLVRGWTPATGRLDELGGAFAVRARRSALLLRARAYAVVLRLGRPTDDAD